MFLASLLSFPECDNHDARYEAGEPLFVCAAVTPEALAEAQRQAEDAWNEGTDYEPMPEWRAIGDDWFLFAADGRIACRVRFVAVPAFPA